VHYLGHLANRYFFVRKGGAIQRFPDDGLGNQLIHSESYLLHQFLGVVGEEGTSEAYEDDQSSDQYIFL